jgi:hypothetical protein
MDVEAQALAGVKGAAGLELSLEAINEVIGHERDVILARSAHALPCSALLCSALGGQCPAVQCSNGLGNWLLDC